MNDHEITTLLDRAGSELRPDVPDLVARGAARGRATRRRHRAGAAIAAVAVVGVAGAGVFAAQLHAGPGDTTVVDPAGAPSGKVAPKPAAADSHAAQPAPDAPLALEPEAIRAEIAKTMPGESGPILREAPYPVVSSVHDRILHFRYEGTLTSFIIEPARGATSCEESEGECAVVDGVEVLTSGPTTADQVTAQGVSVWRHGYVVSVLSYNAAEGKDVAPLTAEPPIGLATLTDIALSDAWYS
jgi:hypothetical protein